MPADFEIEFRPKREGGYEIEAEVQGGKGRADLLLPFPEEEVEAAVGDRVRRSTEAVYGPHAGQLMAPRSLEFLGPSPSEVGRGGETEDPAYIVELGNELFTAIFHDEVGNLYQQTKADGLRLRLSLNLGDPFQRALSRLPWECMIESARSHDVGFLSADVGSPVVRDVDIGTPLRQAEFELPLRILLVTANPVGTKQLDLETEDRLIENTFGALRGQGLVDLTRRSNASYDDLDECLEAGDFHVLHYMGHGDYEEGLGVLALQGEDGGKQLIDGPSLASLLRQQTDRRMRFVFMNACNTGAEGAGQKPFGGVATAVLEAGVPAVIGMQHQIEDNAAIEFARGVYGRIVKGDSIDRAVSHARRKVIVAEGGAGRSTNFWLTPVLYMRNGVDGVLFREEARGSQDPPPAAPRDPEPAPPPAEVVDDELPWIWLSRFSADDGRLVLNWRAPDDPDLTDRVALFDAPPTDPEAWLDENWAFVVAEDEHRHEGEEGFQFVTNVEEDSGTYWVAYLRENDDLELEVVAQRRAAGAP